MIEIELMTAVGKPSDLKVCKQCMQLNWYENEDCHNIDCFAEGEFDENADAVNKKIKSEYDFYMKEEGMTEEEVDHILIEV